VAACAWCKKRYRPNAPTSYIVRDGRTIELPRLVLAYFPRWPFYRKVCSEPCAAQVASLEVSPSIELGETLMGFKEDYEEEDVESTLPGFISQDEKKSLIDNATPLNIVGVREGVPMTGASAGVPTWYVDVEARFKGSRKLESRTLSFNKGTNVPNRDNMLAQMLSWFEQDGAEPVPAVLVKQGRSIYFELA